MSPSAESARVSAGDGTRRVRTQRVVTNVAMLGGIHSVDVNTVTPCLSDVDNSALTDSATYRNLRPIRNHWTALNIRSGVKHGRMSGMQERGVIRVVSTPAGVKPIKSRYVYKRKYNKDGSFKKCKSRLVALGYSQVLGVDVFNTFAPVVKSITVRLLLALALYSICIYTNWKYLMLSAMHILTVMYICSLHLINHYHVITALSWRSLCMGYGALHPQVD